MLRMDFGTQRDFETAEIAFCYRGRISLGRDPSVASAQLSSLVRTRNNVTLGPGARPVWNSDLLSSGGPELHCGKGPRL
jgi:hypothetical protein